MNVRHIPQIVRLAGPMYVGQLAAIANPFMDTMMVSRYSVEDLGALSVSASIYLTVFFALFGIMQALAPTFGQLFGASDFTRIGHEARQGVWLALMISVPGFLILFFPGPYLALAGAPEAFVAKSTLYLKILAFSLPAQLLFQVYANLNNAMAQPKRVMAIQIIGVIVKFPLNILFIFGWLSVPEMGGPGCALATTIIMYLQIALAFAALSYSNTYRPFALFKGSFLPDASSLRQLFKLGVPMGINTFIEVTAWTLMAIFIARIGVTQVAGHQVISNLGGIFYMLPAALGNAVSMLTAHAIGAKDLPRARSVSATGIVFSSALAVVVAAFVWFAQDYLLLIYTSDPGVTACAKPLFLFLCIVILFDPCQACSAFCLRSYKVVYAPTLIYATSLWVFGIGLGCVFGFNLTGNIPDMITGASGFWCSNAISIIILSFALPLLLRHVQNKEDEKAAREKAAEPA